MERDWGTNREMVVGFCGVMLLALGDRLHRGHPLSGVVWVLYIAGWALLALVLRSYLFRRRRLAARIDFACRPARSAEKGAAIESEPLA